MENKEKLRKMYKNKIAGINLSERKKADREICEKIIKKPVIKKSKNVMIYISREDEVDTKNIIDILISSGKNIYVPVTTDTEIKISRLKNMDDLIKGKFGILEPRPEHREYISHECLDVVIVPGLCFTTKGRRLGRGGGYFDRFLKKIMPKTKIIGICYSSQIEDLLPKEKYDVDMDEVITDSQLNKGGKKC
ncbi:MAG: 5-formyltetrahydrofolate cyclo-ligase [Elusimicrobiota bacterium]